MGKTEEQFAKLEGFIEELAIQADKSKAAYEKAEQFMSAVSNIVLNTHENFNVYRQSLKESFSSHLEYYRDRIAIIRTISPETANYLEQKLNEFEKITLTLMRDIDRLEKISFDPSPNKTEARKDMDEIGETIKLLPKKGGSLRELIELNHNFLQDILKFLRPE